MTMPSPAGPSASLPQSAANRETLASYRAYAEAQRAVDFLSDQKFPVQHLSIVGADLKLVETVTGRLTSWRATLAGAASGAWFGLLIGLFLAIFTPQAGFGLVLWALAWGVVAGAVFGYVGYLMTGGKRDFVSYSQIVAGRYDVLVDPAKAAEARALLERLNA
ncbi:hypothetical protein C3Y87_14360 [Carbonactinospora thermoautotrophica]|uniref:Membrane protein n=1 Tax=Carbonactinospora thermoautotrophica TaxID=1469144 RepID=A0A132MN46_9ACTN|nr:general stress protein [Carbonactinospora thermoautotrophica]KWW99290.1 hypothetical protein LI90_924 [Carbonactinospora thermoautotrophica]KWX04949.1 membrane protein [Carbonactinospora thermoautotrophica]KWX10002.1 membrane protein [Carbonactinospora thermoautotrophica]MCX9192577.1 hypothetical protein [Carbonactinospora thermoautotrophica]